MRFVRTGLPAEPVDAKESSRWFRTAAGHRFGREIALLLVLKVVLLAALWWVAVRPAERADTSPTSVARHLGPPPPAQR